MNRSSNFQSGVSWHSFEVDALYPGSLGYVQKLSQPSPCMCAASASQFCSIHVDTADSCCHIIAKAVNLPNTLAHPTLTFHKPAVKHSSNYKKVRRLSSHRVLPAAPKSSSNQTYMQIYKRYDAILDMNPIYCRLRTAPTHKIPASPAARPSPSPPALRKLGSSARYRGWLWISGCCISSVALAEFSPGPCQF